MWKNYGSFVGLINVDEISNAVGIAHARQDVFSKVSTTLSYYFEEDLNAVADHHVPRSSGVGFDAILT